MEVWRESRDTAGTPDDLVQAEAPALEVLCRQAAATQAETGGRLPFSPYRAPCHLRGEIRPPMTPRRTTLRPWGAFDTDWRGGLGPVRRI